MQIFLQKAAIKVLPSLQQVSCKERLYKLTLEARKERAYIIIVFRATRELEGMHG